MYRYIPCGWVVIEPGQTPKPKIYFCFERHVLCPYSFRVFFFSNIILPINEFNLIGFKIFQFLLVGQPLPYTAYYHRSIYFCVTIYTQQSVGPYFHHVLAQLRTKKV